MSSSFLGTGLSKSKLRRKTLVRFVYGENERAKGIKQKNDSLRRYRIVTQKLPCILHSKRRRNGKKFHLNFLAVLCLLGYSLSL